MVDNYREHILDGFVIEDGDGELRFVDAPEVARTAERAVRLTIDSAAAAQLPPPAEAASPASFPAAAAQLPPPEKAPPTFAPRRSGRLGKLLGGNWRRR